jgi:hypothetical protein
MRRVLPALILLSTLSACDMIGGGSAEDKQVTETRMDDLDSLEGTISDEMIDTDTVNDEAMIEAAPVAGDKSAAKKVQSKVESKAEAKAEPVAKAESGKAEGE